MTREIKFRAWHKDEKVMMYDKRMGDCLRWCEEGQPVELMQYTGLKDKNGKEIYEEDIVKYTSNERTGTRVSYKRRGYDTYSINSDIEIIGRVRQDTFDNMVTFIVDTEQTTQYESYFWGEGKRSDRPSIAKNSLVKPISTKREYEVIGNIYENPELLEAK